MAQGGTHRACRPGGRLAKVISLSGSETASVLCFTRITLQLGCGVGPLSRRVRLDQSVAEPPREMEANGDVKEVPGSFFLAPPGPHLPSPQVLVPGGSRPRKCMQIAHVTAAAGEALRE